MPKKTSQLKLRWVLSCLRVAIHPLHLIDDGCYGRVTLILFLAGLFYVVVSKEDLLTNYHAERKNKSEDQAPSLSHIKDIKLDR